MTELVIYARRPPVELDLVRPSSRSSVLRLVSVGRGCGCASGDVVAAVMAEIGMGHAAAMHADPDRDWTAEDWRAHISEEHDVLFPLLLEAGRGDPTVAEIVADLERDHAVYLARLSAGLDLPRGGEPHSVDAHGAIEDGLVREYASELHRMSARVGGLAVSPIGKSSTITAIDSAIPVKHAAPSTSSWWPWVVGGAFGMGAWVVGLGPLGIALSALGGTVGTGVAQKIAQPAAASPPSLLLFVAPPADALDQEADDVYDYAVAYWSTYEGGVGGKPAPGVSGAVAAIDAAAANIDADIQARIAKGQANEEAFLGAVGFFFGSSGRGLFEKVIGFAHWLEGSDKGCADPALRDEAKVCADAYATYGAPIYLVSDRYSAWSLTNYCQLRGQYCGMRDDFLLQTPAAQEALRTITATMLAKAKTPAVARILSFSLGAFVTDGPDHLVSAVKSANAIPRPRGGRGMSDARWFVAVAQLAAAQYGSNPRAVARAVYRETKDRSWQFSKEFPGEILSRLKGHLARTYDYGAGEHHVANPPGGDTAIRAQWARLAYLAAQGKSIRGLLDDLIIPAGYNVGEDAAGGVPMGE